MTEREKIEKRLQLEMRMEAIKKQLIKLTEDNTVVGTPSATIPNPAPGSTPVPNMAPAAPATPVATAPAAPAPAESNEESESIFDARPGETVVFNFQDVTIKVQRQLDDLFKVVDAAESQKLKDNDYIKIQGNDTLKAGKQFIFLILRQALEYKSNPLTSWKVIKNR